MNRYVLVLAVSAVIGSSIPFPARAESQAGGLPAVSARVTTLESTVATQQTTLATLQAANTALNGTVADLAAAVAALQGNLASLQTTLAALQGDNGNLKNAVLALADRVAALERGGAAGTPIAIGENYTVPAGKRFRIETVSGRALANANNDGLWVIGLALTSGGNPVEVTFVPVADRTSRGEQWRFHQQTSLVADPGTTVSFSVQCTGCPGAGTTRLAATGFLVDAD